MEERTGLSLRHEVAAGRKEKGQHAALTALNSSLTPITPTAGSVLECGFIQ